MNKEQFDKLYQKHAMWVLIYGAGEQLHLQNDKICDCDLTGYWLCGAIFENCVFEDCCFDYANLDGTCFRECVFINCHFHCTDAKGCDFQNSCFEGCEISNTELEYSNFYHAIFDNCNIESCFLSQTCIDDCNLSKIELVDCQMYDTYTDFTQYALRFRHGAVSFEHNVGIPSHMFLKDGFGYEN